MTRVTVFVGLDYHQDSVQVCVMDREGLVLANRRCANSSRTIRAVVHRYGRHVRAAIEACSGAAELAEELVSRGAWSLPPWLTAGSAGCTTKCRPSRQHKSDVTEEFPGGKVDESNRNPVLAKTRSTAAWASGSCLDGAVFTISKTPTWATRHRRGMMLG